MKYSSLVRLIDTLRTKIKYIIKQSCAVLWSGDRTADRSSRQLNL